MDQVVRSTANVEDPRSFFNPDQSVFLPMPPNDQSTGWNVDLTNLFQDRSNDRYTVQQCRLGRFGTENYMFEMLVADAANRENQVRLISMSNPRSEAQVQTGDRNYDLKTSIRFKYQQDVEVEDPVPQ